MITSLTGRRLLSEMPRLPWQRLAHVLDELLEHRAVEAEALAPANAICDGDRLRPRNRLSTGSSSTMRNRKKLNTSTNASVPMAPATLPTTNRAVTAGSPPLLAFVSACSRRTSQQ